uniref:Uncharacterized protein AlNc14C223G9164 n=1 Tax=Albugo laibachii Nc14 TaxID=890382 RepID=F0WS22_9STRA|nr:conserved hypothetical protein [Albugo laibachii Nc14]|eukprot:CCA24140.1 conserved hypothetical protein [Albugo laibachii Nc14]
MVWLDERLEVYQTTGEHRGFAFAEFGTLEDAVSVFHAFANEPLFLDHRPISFAYTENYRSNRLANETGIRGVPRLDWICEQCHVNNFARRVSCFKCAAMKPENPVEIPQIHYQQPVPPARSFGSFDEMNECETPSNVLVARMLPSEADEGALQVAFASFSGIQDIRLVRDRLSSQSRGFAFIEFVDVECAAAALKAAGNGRILVLDTAIRLAFAREGYHYRVHGNALPVSTTHRSNSIAAIALEQAQWALANGYASQQPSSTDDTPPLQNVTGDDVCDFLDQAAAAARPHIEEPRKPWPIAFEKGGGGYIFAKEYGLYYDTDSMCYFDPQAKLYYNVYTGCYYTYKNDDEFEPFLPPLPIDDAVFTGKEGSLKDVIEAKSIQKPVMKLSFAKTALKTKPLHSFSNLVQIDSKHLAPSVVQETPNRKRKHAKEIARWSQVQKACNVVQSEPENVDPSTQSNESIVHALADVPTEAPICLLCRRKFKSITQLRKHETLSELHKENLAKAKEHKDAISAQMQLIEMEERKAKKHQSGRIESNPTPIAISKERTEPKSDALESGIGGKMLKMMGWKKGRGLGKDGKGITTIINPTPFSDAKAGLGSMTGKTVTDVSGATYREKIQISARARFEAASRE